MELQTNGNLVSIGDTWSDYDLSAVASAQAGGDIIYGDFEYDAATGTVVNRRSFEPGIARVDPWVSSGIANTKYYHADLIGTTRGLSTTTSPATFVDETVYTAFGEPVAGPGINGAPGAPARYGYAGAWGYQADDTTAPANRFPFLHVGARYYDPSTGRFLQRDPSGIGGGVNVYSYGPNRPTGGIDIGGQFWLEIISGIGGGIVTGAVGGFLVGGPAGAVAGGIAGGIAGGASALVGEVGTRGALTPRAAFTTGLLSGIPGGAVGGAVAAGASVGAVAVIGAATGGVAGGISGGLSGGVRRTIAGAVGGAVTGAIGGAASFSGQGVPFDVAFGCAYGAVNGLFIGP